MRTTGALLALVLIASVLTGCLGNQEGQDPASTTPALADGEGLAFQKVHTPEEIVAILEDLDDLPPVSVKEIGRSFEDRPLHLVTLGTGETELWIVGRQHGNEPTGAEAILLAIETLADPEARPAPDAPAIVQALHEHREELLERLTFLFLPVANPDGAAAYQRTTTQGQDPNRDHFLFTQPAMQVMREAFWAHRPDGCLDLHNEGQGATDYDAFAPIGPLLEAEPEATMLRDANLTVREVDAAGGNAGSVNENYRAPSPADDQPNPTAVHPGTHDMFCTARGAPGWTPEGAIPGGENGIDTLPFAWATRNHWVTIAASAFHWAGAYDATEPIVTKHEGPLGPLVQETVELAETGDARFQAVWRQTTTAGDHNPAPVVFQVTAPDGTTYDGREPGPEQWTSTVDLDDAEPGTYALSLQAAPGGTYELRAYLDPAPTPLVTVQRTETGLAVQAAEHAPGTVKLTLTDVADPPADGTGVPEGARLATFQTPVDERAILTYQVQLDPGQEVVYPVPSTWVEAGPYRFTASSGDVLHTGVEQAFNPAPDQ